MPASPYRPACPYPIPLQPPLSRADALPGCDPAPLLTHCGHRAPAPPLCHVPDPQGPLLPSTACQTSPSFSSSGFKRGHTTTTIAFPLPCSPLCQLMCISPPTAPLTSWPLPETRASPTSMDFESPLSPFTPFRWASPLYTLRPSQHAPHYPLSSPVLQDSTPATEVH
jgi:hypothetical protein